MGPINRTILAAAFLCGGWQIASAEVSFREAHLAERTGEKVKIHFASPLRPTSRWPCHPRRAGLPGLRLFAFRGGQLNSYYEPDQNAVIVVAGGDLGKTETWAYRYRQVRDKQP